MTILCCFENTFWEPQVKDTSDHSSQEESRKCANVHKFHKDFKELIEGYENYEGEFVDMSQPRDASYVSNSRVFNEHTGLDTVEIERLGEGVKLTSKAKHEFVDSFDPSRYRSMDTEVRGITLRQLRAIIPLIKRRCEEEKWTRKIYKDGKETGEEEAITLENATLYDVNDYITKPFTEHSKKSFVETLPSTKGTQPPRWFVSHYWGETFLHTLACLEQMVKDFEINDPDYNHNVSRVRARGGEMVYNDSADDFDPDASGGGMTEDTPIWICAFANNQHDLQSEITSNPADSAFAKAMNIANFRVISILDVKNQVYSRLWCMYELYLTLILSKQKGMDGVLAVYTYHEHEFKDFRGKTIHKSVVGFVEGGPTNYASGYKESLTHFPRERLFKSLSVSIQNAKASREDDRKNILNAVVGRSGNAMELEPLKNHENHEMYEELNNNVRGVFASTKACLKFAYDDENKDNWNETLHALKHSVTKSMDFDHLSYFKAQDVADIFHHLPIGLEELKIEKCPHGRVAMDALLDWLENTSTNLKKLDISYTCIGGEVGGKECGKRLAKFLARDDCKIEELELRQTDLVGSRNVDTWIECLEKNQSLKDVTFIGMNIYVKRVRELPNSSIDVPDPDEDELDITEILHSDVKGKIYWDGTTFPDGTLSTGKTETLKERVSKSMDSFAITCFLNENMDQWNESMKYSATKSMEIRDYYLSDFKAEDVSDVLHYLPIGLEELRIWKCPHGRVAMDALLDWLENTSTNLKTLYIFGTCIGGEVGGKECGERLAKFLAQDDCKIEWLKLCATDLVGSRNVDTWIECLEKNQSLKDVTLIGMNIYVKMFRELPNSSIDVPDPDEDELDISEILHSDVKGKIYWDGTTFPDGTLSTGKTETLKERVSKSMDSFAITCFLNENKDQWNESMKYSATKSMEIDYLSDFKAEDVSDVLHHLPIGLEELNVYECPHGRVAMDALLDWLENTSTNLKTLYIFGTCIGGEVGGKECGERLAKFLAQDDCKIEWLKLCNTDLVGSRNVDTWIECLEKNQSLKDVQFGGMASYVEDVEESELPNTSIDVPSSRVKGEIYWDGTTFPDGTLSREQENELKERASKSIEDVYVVRVVLEDSTD
ncbi:hypothetical protein CTEN210_06839 [Chaetoceros tenuissimus]|uniref:Uncharacterized protein n=1 Tax=Chaetoceros tenuissimus TaxID=426638 RepID=A0AAD3CQN3_9STRA|nr:hypothetical protein CTEN210_06839 [Chaetoceros tenuissimus]